jgi:hypothetical protein
MAVVFVGPSLHDKTDCNTKSRTEGNAHCDVAHRDPNASTNGYSNSNPEPKNVGRLYWEHKTSDEA